MPPLDGPSSANAKQVALAVESVNEVTQAAAASAGEMSGATEEVSQMAQDLRRLVEHFRIAAGAEQVLQDTPLHAESVARVAESPPEAV